MSDLEPKNNKDRPSSFSHFVHSLDKSAIFTVIGIILLFSTSICVTLLAPRYVDPTWTTPSSTYQELMYEVSDPNLYISSLSTGEPILQYLYHLKDGFTLLAFHETETTRFVAPPSLKKYITSLENSKLKLTSRLLMLRKPQKSASFDAIAIAEAFKKELQQAWIEKHPKWKEEKQIRPTYDVFELFEPQTKEAFALAPEGVSENWIDRDFQILDQEVKHPYHKKEGVIYVNNPLEYRFSKFAFNDQVGWRYDPEGDNLKDLKEMQNHPLGFKSRAELIAVGEHIYAIEGCWYCHTDQTRTLVQDVVLNGSDSYPAPPSSANEYIYQKITFPGTRRIGPDISRVGIKRPSRDWHKGHFWSPKTASKGSIMPAFRHFFDDDPRGTAVNTMGIPNYKFEAIYQYLMTKGTRITPPNQAWWLGMDPVRTKEIIEGRQNLPK